MTTATSRAESTIARPSLAGNAFRARLSLTHDMTAVGTM